MQSALGAEMCLWPPLWRTFVLDSLNMGHVVVVAGSAYLVTRTGWTVEPCRLCRVCLPSLQSAVRASTSLLMLSQLDSLPPRVYQP